MSFQHDIHVKPQRDHDHRAPTSIMTRSVSHLLTYNPDFKERIVHSCPRDLLPGYRCPEKDTLDGKRANMSYVLAIDANAVACFPNFPISQKSRQSESREGGEIKENTTNHMRGKLNGALCNLFIENYATTAAAVQVACRVCKPAMY